MQDDFVYANQFYEVRANEGNNGYIIISKMTGVVEGTSEVLPSAISKADVWSTLMGEIVTKLQG